VVEEVLDVFHVEAVRLGEARERARRGRDDRKRGRVTSEE
jgi:hypothetical protein